MNIWFNAALDKYRFNTSKGNLATEDLFDLSMEDLDSLYSNLSDEMDELSSGASLFDEGVSTEKSDEIEAVKDKMGIVKSIFNYHKSNLDAQIKAAKIKAMKDELNEVIAQKQKDELASMSVEQLKEIRDSL